MLSTVTLTMSAMALSDLKQFLASCQCSCSFLCPSVIFQGWKTLPSGKVKQNEVALEGKSMNKLMKFFGRGIDHARLIVCGLALILADDHRFFDVSILKITGGPLGGPEMVWQ